MTAISAMAGSLRHPVLLPVHQRQRQTASVMMMLVRADPNSSLFTYWHPAGRHSVSLIRYPGRSFMDTRITAAVWDSLQQESVLDIATVNGDGYPG